MCSMSAEVYTMSFAALDEFNMYTKGFSKPRKKDLLLKKSKFTKESFNISSVDLTSQWAPPLPDSGTLPFAEPMAITQFDKTYGKRIDFGIAIFPGKFVKLRCFGHMRDHKLRKGVLVYDQPKSITNVHIIQWLQYIGNTQVMSTFFFYKNIIKKNHCGRVVKVWILEFEYKNFYFIGKLGY